MTTSPFLAHLQRLFKFLVGYDVKTRKFNLWIGCYTMTNIIAFGTTAYRFSLHKVPKKDVMEQMTMTTGLAVFILNSSVIIRSKNKLGKLIENLLEPIKTSEESTSKTKELRDYAKWVNLLGIFYMILFYVINCCVTVTLKPILTQKHISKTCDVQSIPLPFGWIPFHTESYIVYYIAFFMGVMSIFGVGAFFTCQMTLSFSALKIKLSLKLLAKDVRNIDDIVESRTLQRVKQLSMISLQLTTQQMMTLSMECRKDLLKELVERHLGVIRSVKLLNDCFSLSALVLVQATSLIAALTLPRAILITKLPIWDLYFVLSSGCGVLILSFFLCYFGQVIEDESNNLRRALYDYNWYNQTQRFKAHVMIMITMATRPLQLTAGGIYPLNFETFTYVMSAFYSYVHFLLALKEKGKIG
ncbi:Or2ap [Homalodisca vitripennis]|nr:Or2ap [Homalodisca vitripennis]